MEIIVHHHPGLAPQIYVPSQSVVNQQEKVWQYPVHLQCSQSRHALWTTWELIVLVRPHTFWREEDRDSKNPAEKINQHFVPHLRDLKTLPLVGDSGIFSLWEYVLTKPFQGLGLIAAAGVADLKGFCGVHGTSISFPQKGTGENHWLSHESPDNGQINNLYWGGTRSKPLSLALNSCEKMHVVPMWGYSIPCGSQ